MKKVKYYVSLAIVLIAAVTVRAQEAADLNRIILAPYISEQVDFLPASAKKNIESKLVTIVNNSGLSASGYDARFVITPTVNVVSKNVIAAAPPKIALTLDVVFHVGDGKDGIKFASKVKTLKGVGSTEARAYISAFKNIRTNDEDLLALVDEAKERIFEFYNTRCDFILNEARLAASQNKFEEAIYILSAVPDINKECYEKAVDMVLPMYVQKINRECRSNLAAAQAAWNSGQDYEAALKAGEFLGKIDPDADCYAEAQALTAMIGDRVAEIDAREWDFKLKEQQDDIDLRNNAIDAARQIGVSYGDNQPETVNYNTKEWF